jgi:elongator complex protein 3
VRREYATAGGTEVFLSFEDRKHAQLASLLRLRIPDPEADQPPVLHGAALVRELHSYGQHVPIAQRAPGAVQHRGYGRRLLKEAERIAGREYGRARIAVIAGVGVREYYRRLGYALQDTYMVKTLA